MIRLAERWRRRSTDDAPSVGEDVRVYCIGDIHGCLGLLLDLEQMVASDSAGYSGRKVLVYLGDYIDRGDESRGVLEHLLQEPLDGFEAVHLKGNHEQAMLDFLRHPEAAAAWLGFGGRETLASYGIEMSWLPTPEQLRDAAEQLRERLPAAHLAFLEGTVMSWSIGDYYFVHAGIRPGVALHAQHPDDQMWIREEFTGSTRDHGVVVVHGHTITMEPEFLPNRIGLDTGAFHTGVLTCLVLDSTHRRVLQTGHPDV